MSVEVECAEGVIAPGCDREFKCRRQLTAISDQVVQPEEQCQTQSGQRGGCVEAVLGQRELVDGKILAHVAGW